MYDEMRLEIDALRKLVAERDEKIDRMNLEYNELKKTLSNNIAARLKESIDFAKLNEGKDKKIDELQQELNYSLIMAQLKEDEQDQGYYDNLLSGRQHVPEKLPPNVKRINVRV